MEIGKRKVFRVLKYKKGLWFESVRCEKSGDPCKKHINNFGLNGSAIPVYRTEQIGPLNPAPVEDLVIFRRNSTEK